MAKAKKPRPAARKPRLSAKQKRVLQRISEGMDHADAYLWAGFKTTRRGAVNSVSRLLASDGAREYLDKLLEKRREIEAEANRQAAEKLSISKERLLGELAKMAFAEMRHVADWHGHLVEEEDNPDGGDVAVVKRTYSNHVSLISADKIDDETHGAIAEISQNVAGGVKIKMHDKRGAIMDLCKLLGYLVEPGATPQKPLHISATTMTPKEAAEAYAATLHGAP